MAPTLIQHRVAIAALFFINGALFATWVSRIPGIRERAALSEAGLGIALLALWLGKLSAVPLAGWLIGRTGSRAVVSATALVCCGLLPLVAWVSSLPSLAPVLVLLGAALASMDVAMNSQAALVERMAGRSLMGSFHGLWSLGGLCGASVGGVLAQQAYLPDAHFLSVASALALVALWTRRGLVRDGPHAAAPRLLAWPSRAVLAIGVVGAFSAVVEGGVADWSAVYLRDALGTGAGYAAAGYAAYSLAMMTGRLAGDRLIDRLGSVRLLRMGPTLTGLALAVALVSGRPAVAIVAFVLVGLGMSTVFPILYGAASRAPGTAPGQGIAGMATMAQVGGLVGPPVIGFAADATSLPVGLGVLVLACGVIAALAGRATAAAGDGVRGPARALGIVEASGER